MKRINNILLELYKDKDQLLVLSILFSLDYWLQPLLPSDPNVNQAAGALIVLEKEKDKFKAFEYVNPYASAKNQFENMENTMEDLTVNTQQADFQAEQGAQQRSNIMETMRGAAGGSGIAGLAQAMAGQGQLATQQASASIGQQEAANQKAAAQQAGTIQTQERTGEQSAEALRLRGEEMVARQEADEDAD